MVDLANWWCHAILQQQQPDLKLFQELESLLEFLAPIDVRSPLCVRLQCLAIWQELVKQTATAFTAPLSSPSSLLEERDFSSVQDKFILLHARLFAVENATAASASPSPKPPAGDSSSSSSTKMDYEEVVRMIRVHSELSNLYKILNEDKFSQAEMDAAVEESLRRGRDDIYLLEQNIPDVLKELVNKGNGWDAQARRKHIHKIVFGKDSELSCSQLQRKVSSSS
jgi:hypothetical protein